MSGTYTKLLEMQEKARKKSQPKNSKSSQKKPKKRTPERVNGRTPEQVNARTGERANARTGERKIERHSFNIYREQYEALRQMEIEALMKNKRFNKSQFVREAIAKKMETLPERPNG